MTVSYDIHKIFIMFKFHAGSGLVQFEPHKDRMAMRVLKIIEPVQDLVQDYDGYVHRPKEGAPLERSSVHSGKPTVVVRYLREAMKDALMLPVNFEDLP